MDDVLIGLLLLFVGIGSIYVWYTWGETGNAASEVRRMSALIGGVSMIILSIIWFVTLQ